jgi:Bacteriocin-protection, YdeI or OmpD-Associated
VVEPPDFARVLNADPIARTSHDRLAYGHKLQHVRAIERAKKPDTRERRIEKAVAMLGDPGFAPRSVRPEPRTGKGSGRKGSLREQTSERIRNQSGKITRGKSDREDVRDSPGLVKQCR